MRYGGHLLLMAGALGLGGCQLPLFHSAQRAAPQLEAAPLRVQDSSTKLGQRYLDEGQLGQAIESFRIAIVLNEKPAPALNGLGVAFARLGRMDAAQTLFAKARALDPAEPRYARNLERAVLAQSALQQQMASLETKVLPPPVAAAAAPAPIQAGRLVRLSSHELTIRTAEPASGARPVVAARFKPLVRMALPSANDAEATSAAVLAPAGTKLAMATRGFKPVVRIPLGKSENAETAPPPKTGKRRIVQIARLTGAPS